MDSEFLISSVCAVAFECPTLFNVWLPKGTKEKNEREGKGTGEKEGPVAMGVGATKMAICLFVFISVIRSCNEELGHRSPVLGGYGHFCPP